MNYMDKQATSLLDSFQSDTDCANVDDHLLYTAEEFWLQQVKDLIVAPPPRLVFMNEKRRHDILQPLDIVLMVSPGLF